VEDVFEIPETLEALNENDPSCPVPSLPIEPKNQVPDSNKDGEEDEECSCVRELPINR
jgi:hypothetical protein